MTKSTIQIPGSMTEVDSATGKETHKPMAWSMLPPAKGKCQICAADHGPKEPHNAQSLYYQMAFQGIVGRAPTWADAIEHCDEPLRRAWEAELRRRNAWSEPPDGDRPVKHHGIEP